MSKEKMQQARKLIQERDYEGARAILQKIDHPTAREWLAKIDQIAPQKSKPTPSSKKGRSRPILLILVFVVLVVVAAVFLLGGGSDDTTPTTETVTDSTPQPSNDITPTTETITDSTPQPSNDITPTTETITDSTDIPEDTNTGGIQFSAATELTLGTVTLFIEHPPGWVVAPEDDGEIALGSTSHAIDSIKLNPGSPLATFEAGEAALEISVVDTAQFGLTDPVRILETSLSFITNSPNVTSGSPETLDNGARATLTTPTYAGMVYVIQAADDVFLYIRAGGAANTEAVIAAIVEKMVVE